MDFVEAQESRLDSRLIISRGGPLCCYALALRLNTQCLGSVVLLAMFEIQSPDPGKHGGDNC